MQLLPLAIIQSLLLAGGQVFLKLALGRMQPFGWNWQFWSDLLVNWQFALCGLLYAALVFHEEVSVTRWLGVLLIMAGCYFIAK